MAVVFHKGLNRHLSHLPGVKAAVREKGRAVETTAKALFGPHDRPGGHAITGESQDPDYLVILEGPAPGAVEFGREGYTRPDGAHIGPAQGLHVLGRAADL
jgi:hypothetical protein